MVPQVPCVGCGVLGSPTCLGPVRWPPTVKVSVLGEGSPLTRYVNLSSAHSEPRQAHASTVPRRHAHSRAVWLFQIRLTRSRGNTPGTSCRLTTMNHLEPSALGHSAPGSHSTRATRRRCPARPLRLCGRSEPTRGAGLHKCHPPGTPCHLALHSPQAMFVSSAQRHRTIRRGLSPCLRVCARLCVCRGDSARVCACAHGGVRVRTRAVTGNPSATGPPPGAVRQPSRLFCALAPLSVDISLKALAGNTAGGGEWQGPPGGAVPRATRPAYVHTEAAPTGPRGPGPQSLNCPACCQPTGTFREASPFSNI